jgi:nucleolar protein 4
MSLLCAADGVAGVQVKKWRIILRNLPFGVTEEELQKLLLPVGFVWRAHIPKEANGKMKGFGFLSFTCRAAAANAIAAMNGKVRPPNPLLFVLEQS